MRRNCKVQESEKVKGEGCITMKSIKIKLIVFTLMVLVLFASSVSACECWWFYDPPCYFTCEYVFPPGMYAVWTAVYVELICYSADDPTCTCTSIYESRKCADVLLYAFSPCDGIVWGTGSFYLTKDYATGGDSCWLCE